MNFIKISYIAEEVDLGYYGNSQIVSSSTFYSKTQSVAEFLNEFSQWINKETYDVISDYKKSYEIEKEIDLEINKLNTKLSELTKTRTSLYTKVHAFIVLNSNEAHNPYRDKLDDINKEISDIREKTTKLYSKKEERYSDRNDTITLAPYTDLDIETYQNRGQKYLYQSILDVVSGNYNNMGIILEDVLYNYISNSENWKKLEIQSINTIVASDDDDLITEKDLSKPMSYTFVH